MTGDRRSVIAAFVAAAFSDVGVAVAHRAVLPDGRRLLYGSRVMLYQGEAFDAAFAAFTAYRFDFAVLQPFVSLVEVCPVNDFAVRVDDGPAVAGFTYWDGERHTCSVGIGDRELGLFTLGPSRRANAIPDGVASASQGRGAPA